MITEIQKLHESLKRTNTDLELYSSMYDKEEKTIPSRIAHWERLVNMEKEKQNKLQNKYHRLKSEFNELMQIIQKKQK